MRFSASFWLLTVTLIPSAHLFDSPAPSTIVMMMNYCSYHTGSVLPP